MQELGAAVEKQDKVLIKAHGQLQTEERLHKEEAARHQVRPRCLI